MLRKVTPATYTFLTAEDHGQEEYEALCGAYGIDPTPDGYGFIWCQPAHKTTTPNPDVGSGVSSMRNLSTWMRHGRGRLIERRLLSARGGLRAG
jgi:hypothetical protein